MDTANNSRYSFDSTFDCEESSTNIKLNTAMFMSIDEEILSSDEIFYDANELPSPVRSVETESVVSIESEAGHAWQFSHIFEHTDSTSLISLPKTNRYLDNKNTVNCTGNSLPCSHTTQEINLPYEQYADPEKENYRTNKHLPLNVILKRMFDDILGRLTNSEGKSNTTCSTKTSTNEIYLNNDTFSTIMSSDTVDKNNNVPLCQAPKYDKSTSSIESIKDSSGDISSQNISTYFLNRFFPKKLITILENSNENTTNIDIDESSDNSGKYIGRLANYTKIETKHCMIKKIFNATDVEDSESSAFSNTSTNIALISENIIQKANTVQSSDYTEKFDPINANKETVDISDISNKDYNIFSDASLEIIGTDISVEGATRDSSIESEPNSLWALSEFEESDYSSTFPSSKCDSVELSTTNQSSHKEMDNTIDSAIDVQHYARNVKEVTTSRSKGIKKIQRSPFKFMVKNVSDVSPNATKHSRQRSTKRPPTPKKRWKKRRSLSLPEDATEAKNNKMSNKEVNSTSSSLKRRRNSHCIIISPIKPVEYLVTWFTNIASKEKKSIKLSPAVGKLRRPRIPFIFLTPATPK